MSNLTQSFACPDGHIVEGTTKLCSSITHAQLAIGVILRLHLKILSADCASKVHIAAAAPRHT